jgi:hypothetical protein
MITVILEDLEGVELARTMKESNDQYLIREGEGDYGYLSVLNAYDYDVFSSADMTGLIQDLLKIRKSLPEADKTHVDEIVSLARRCKEGTRLTLTFTPFG